MTTSLAKYGTSDWHNLPTKLRDHEKNPIQSQCHEVGRLANEI